MSKLKPFLIDSHCHLFSDDYSDLTKVIKEAREERVKYFLNNGSNKKYNEELIKMLSNYPNMVGSLGIHPESVEDAGDEDLDFIERNLGYEKIVAIGEIGLDYYYGKASKEAQIKFLEKQLKMAEKYEMPVVIHSREATQDTISLLQKYNVKGVIHCFSGSYETAKIYIKMGYKLGVNGVITFKNANIKEVIKKVGLENIVLETDSPYLTPEPYRGRQNCPKHVLEVAKFVADLFDTTLEEVMKVTTNNVLNTFSKFAKIVSCDEND